MVEPHTVPPRRTQNNFRAHVHAGGNDETFRLADGDASGRKNRGTLYSGRTRGNSRDVRRKFTSPRAFHAPGCFHPFRGNGCRIFPVSPAAGIVANDEQWYTRRALLLHLALFFRGRSRPVEPGHNMEEESDLRKADSKGLFKYTYASVRP